VAIVGRPNVGKSALLNCLAKQRIAIVDPTCGVTRDRVSALVEHKGRVIEAWDTGGIGAPDDMAVEIEAQIEIAIRRADLVLLVVDAQEGLQPMDQRVAERLRRENRPVLLVANKVDSPRHQDYLGDFFKLGAGDPVAVSALNGIGRSDLLDRILERTPRSAARPAPPDLFIACVGRQNVGKSTLINTLAREDRVIVSEIPGTTRDSIDVRFAMDGRSYVAIDTAGVKRRSRIEDSVQFYSFARTDAAMRRADVVLFMLDATAKVSRQDQRIGHRIEELGRPCVIVVNKWDLAQTITTEDYRKYLDAHLHMLSYAPVSFISARDGDNVRETIALGRAIHDQSRVEVPTSELNRLVLEAQKARMPERREGVQPHILYATQVSASPPTFLLFASHPHLIGEQYSRYLMNFLRGRLPCAEVPLRLFYRTRHTDPDRVRPGPRKPVARKAGRTMRRPPRPRPGKR
jgi:GTP-binding protein